MKEGKVDISVVIPVYNAEEYIGQCLDTILGQTFQNIEVICVDDGSTDGSLVVLKRYKEKDKRVRVVTQNNINAGAARNHGFKYVTGKYVIFADADDFFEKDMLERMIERAEETNAEVVVVNSDRYLNDISEFAEGWPFVKKRIPKKKVFASSEVEQLFSTFVGWPWDKLILTSFIQKNNLKFQEQQSTNDLYFIYSVLARAKRISVLYEVLAHHRRNVETSISMNREKSWHCAHDALIKLKKQLIDWDIYKGKVKQDYINYTLNHSLWHFDTLKYPAQKEFYDAFRAKWIKEYDLAEQKEEYFYNKWEYQIFENIQKYDYDEYLINKVHELEKQLEIQKEEANRNNEKLQQNINEIINSGSLKIGLAITSLPRKLKKIIKKN